MKRFFARVLERAFYACYGVFMYHLWLKRR